MKTIVLLGTLLLLKSLVVGQEPGQCFVSTVTSGGTIHQSVNVANLNPTPGATSALGGWGFTINDPCYTFGIAYEPLTADTTLSATTNSYEIGLYCVSGSCTSGNLYATTGSMSAATFVPAGTLSTVVTQLWSAIPDGPPPITLPAGLYMLAIGVQGCIATSFCPTIAAETYRGTIYPFFVRNVAPYSFNLPITITPPLINPTVNTIPGTLAMPEIFIY